MNLDLSTNNSGVMPPPLRAEPSAENTVELEILPAYAQTFFLLLFTM